LDRQKLLTNEKDSKLKSQENQIDDLNKLLGDLGEWKNAILEKNNLIFSLQNQLKDFKKLLVQLEGATQLARDKDEQIKVLEANLRDLGQQRNNFEFESKKLVNKVRSEKNAEIVTLQNQLREMITEFDKAQGANQDAEIIDSLNCQIKILNNNIGMKSKECDAGKKLVHHLNNKILQYEGNEKIMKSDLREKDNLIEMLTNSIKASNGEINSLKQKSQQRPIEAPPKPEPRTEDHPMQTEIGILKNALRMMQAQVNS
jgi:predicted RNase H-like nuclease (RuvC/YqgF family)